MEYKLQRSGSFTKNWEYYQLVAITNMHYFFIEPIEKILEDNILSSEDKIFKIIEIHSNFAEKREIYTRFKNNIIDYYSPDKK